MSALIRSVGDSGGVTQVRTSQSSWPEVRCLSCGRLLFRWRPTGVTSVNIKCTRCGKLDTLDLSTG